MKKKNILLIGAGGVAHIAAHKIAQHNDEFGDLVIASRRKEKCDAIARSVAEKKSAKDPSGVITTRALNALDIDETERLIRETKSEIVINLATAFVNMSVLEACLRTGAAYMDTAIHEDPDKVCEDPPWYANYEWKRKDRCRDAGVTAILGVGFDPGMVNAYCAFAARHLFDTIDTIDIMDVNAGSHGLYYATNFDPEINLREFKYVWTWIDRTWQKFDMHSVKRTYEFPAVGEQPVYLNGHDELHSLSKNIDANSIRFWMGFSDNSVNVLTVLRKLGLTSEKPVRTADGIEVVPLRALKAVLPDPMSLAPNYTGKTCIGNLVKGVKDGKPREVFIFNVCDHKACYEETGQHAIFYTAGVPPVAAARLIANGTWNPKTMVNVEELDPVPFLSLLNGMGLPTEMREERIMPVP